MDHTSLAVEVAIEEAELGLSQYTWDNCPFGDIRYGLSCDVEDDVTDYVVDPEEAQEAVEMFEGNHPLDVEVWLESLNHWDAYVVRQAIDALRDISGRYPSPSLIPSILRRIDVRGGEGP